MREHGPNVSKTAVDDALESFIQKMRHQGAGMLSGFKQGQSPKAFLGGSKMLRSLCLPSPGQACSSAPLEGLPCAFSGNFSKVPPRTW